MGEQPMTTARTAQSELRRCGYHIEGPKIGRVVAWRKRCSRRVRIPADHTGLVRCWQHRAYQSLDAGR